MNKSSLSKILGKKGLTGAELGRLAILNNVELLKNYRAGKGNKPLFNEDEINNTARNLTDAQKDIYGRYLDMYAVLNLYYNIGNAMYQQAYNGFNNLMFRLTTLYSGIKTEAQKKDLPLILTEDKYKELKAQSDTEALGYKENYIDLFIEALSFHVSQYEENPEADTLLKGYIDKYKGQPIKNEALRSVYMKDNFEYFSSADNCFYNLSDGTPSQGHTLAEYIEDFLTRPLIVETGDAHIKEVTEIGQGTLKTLTSLLKKFNNAKINGLINDMDDITERTNEATAGRINNFLSEVRNYYTGAGREDVAQAIDDLQHETLRIPKSAYPSQADLIQYWAYLDSPFEKDSTNLKLLKDFEAELPDVAEAIKNDLLSHKVIKDVLKGRSDKGLCEDLIDWGTLSKADIYTYRQRVEDHFTKLHPEAENGISIIVKDTIRPEYLKEGIYQAEIRGMANDFISDNYTEDDFKKFAEHIRSITDTVLIPALKNLYALNYFYADIEDIYEIEDVAEVYSQDTKEITEKVQCINAFKDIILMDLYKLYGNSKEGLIKTFYINKAFKEINIEDLLPDEDQKAQAREVLSDIKNFKGRDYSPKFMYLYVKGIKDTLQVIN